MSRWCRTRKVALYVLPATISPSLFGYALWQAGRAEGWGGWAYGALLARMALVSGLAALALLGVAWLQRRRRKRDWRWLLASAAIVGSPASLLIVLLALE